jgi:hypothetical protein
MHIAECSEISEIILNEAFDLPSVYYKLREEQPPRVLKAY